jgi:hypothetical protein
MAPGTFGVIASMRVAVQSLKNESTDAADFPDFLWSPSGVKRRQLWTKGLM